MLERIQAINLDGGLITRRLFLDIGPIDMPTDDAIGAPIDGTDGTDGTVDNISIAPPDGAVDGPTDGALIGDTDIIDGRFWGRTLLSPKPHPFFGVLGAQTTVQRWYVDNTLNNAGVDRTLRTVFTHDHFGPSSHQQVGLYAGLVVEPQGSVWKDTNTGAILGNNVGRPIADGGPTSWRANIITNPSSNSYREFLLEFADFQHAYLPGGGVDAAGHPIPDPIKVINPPAKQEDALPFNVKKMVECPGGFPLPCPEAISAAEPGTSVVNYRNEPLPLRVRNHLTNTQMTDISGDLSHVFRSDLVRRDPAMNQHNAFTPFYAVDNDVAPGDPFTPLMRAYENDRVQIRILVGAHEEGHNFSVHGMKWMFEPSFVNSGNRNSQMMGISEHFEFIIPALPKRLGAQTADYLYRPGNSVEDAWSGLWGLVRVFKGPKSDLQLLPNNPDGKAKEIINPGDYKGVCLKTQVPKMFDVTAVLAKDVLTAATLTYNSRTTQVTNPNTGETHAGPLDDPTAIMYVRTSDLDPVTGKLKAGVPVEPLILRANAGDCIELTLRNKLPLTAPDLAGWSTFPMIVEKFNANQVRPSSHVGLHPQMLFYDVLNSDGTNAGFNPVQTVAPGQTITYQWYAGDFTVNSTGTGVQTPMELGATNLISSDPLKHSNKGAFGALIIMPAGLQVDRGRQIPRTRERLQCEQRLPVPRLHLDVPKRHKPSLRRRDGG